MNDASIHPTLEQLLAFDRGLLPPSEWPEIDRHVATCASCCHELEGLPEDYMVAVIRNASPLFESDRVPVAEGSHGPRPGNVAHANCEPMADLPPPLVNHPRYRVLAALGSGGMGNVYRAEHNLMGRIVALKLIQNRLLGKPDWIERFRREIRAAAHLNHPNIVHAYDAEQAGDAQVLVMEYVEGETLEQLVERQGPLAMAEACDCARQAALGLSHAFERGMVHRDIKPQNIVRTSAGEIKILDFGLARFASESLSSPALTQSGLTMGTPDYLAPEQALDPRSADIRADIYSLGCTFYFLLTGTPPYPDGTPLQKVLSHQEQTPAPLAERCPQLPMELRRVVEKMMAKDAAARYQTPGEVAAALAPWAAKGHPGVLTVTGPIAQRRRWPILAIAGGLLICLSLGFAATAAKRSALPADSPATVIVVTRMDGASASVIEKAVTAPVEQAVRRAAGAARVESHSIRGLSVVRVHFRDDVSRHLALAATNALVNHVRSHLPADSSPLVMPVDFDETSPIGVLVLKSPHLDSGQLTDFASSHICPRLAAVPGVGPLTVEGGSGRLTLIRLDPAKMQAHNITLLAVSQALKEETGDFVSSHTVFGHNEYEIRARPMSGQQLSKLPLPETMPGHRALYIGDLATIEPSFDADSPIVRVNGAESVVVPIYGMAGVDAGKVVAATEEAIAEMRLLAPDGLELGFYTLRGGAEHRLLRLQLRLPSDASLKRTMSIVSELEEAISAQFSEENIGLLLTRVGAGDDWPTAFGDNAINANATLIVQLNEPASREVEDSASLLRNALRKDERFSQAEIVLTTAATTTVDVKIYDAVLENGRKLADEVRRRVAESGMATYVQIVERLDAPGYELAIDSRKAADLGITAAEIRAQVALATGGQGSSWQDAASGARLHITAFLETIKDLQNLPIGGDRQPKPVILANVAQIQRILAPVEINHDGFERVTHVRVYAERRDRASVVKALQDIITEHRTSPGVRIEVAE